MDILTLKELITSDHDPTVTLATRFVVFEDSDKTEGRGSLIPRYTSVTRAVADIAATGLGVMGRPGVVEEQTFLVLTFGDRAIAVNPSSCLPDFRYGEDFKAHKKMECRARALSKLTPEEIAALGL